MRVFDLIETQGNESIAKAEQYLDYAQEEPHLPGTRFSVRPDAIIIYQEVDDEESDKYVVARSDVPRDTWAAFTAMVRRTIQRFPEKDWDRQFGWK